MSLPEVPGAIDSSAGSKARLDPGSIRRTILDNTIEAEAYRRYLEEMERLPEAMLKKDRAVAHYVHHRDDIIENDHQQHLRQMNKEQIQREIDAEEDLHKLEMARSRRKEQLLKTKDRKTNEHSLCLIRSPPPPLIAKTVKSRSIVRMQLTRHSI